MELKLDVKTLVIGIALGIIFTTVIGAGNADEADFGIAITPGAQSKSEGTALVRTSDNRLYIVSAKSGMAVKVLHATSIRDEPDDRRDIKGKHFTLNSPSESQ